MSRRKSRHCSAHASNCNFPVETTDNHHIHVLKPTLPSAETIFPFLKTIDETRQYTNFGPLERGFTAQLERLFGARAGCVITASSCTNGLISAILASKPIQGINDPGRTLAVCPTFTFPATALAASRSGYELLLTDVDADTWQLSPEALLRHPKLHQFAIVIPVSPLGRPVLQEPWNDFTKKTGIPVVIDAAASFIPVLRNPHKYIGTTPAVFSFHATKTFGVGEGGAIVWNDEGAAGRLLATTNFGFLHDRETEIDGLNAKMSEYHAAVGLAGLMGIRSKVAMLKRRTKWYQDACEQHALHDLVVFPEIDLSFPHYLCATSKEKEHVSEMLRKASIETRSWYGHGLHAQTFFRYASTDDYNVSSDVLSRLVGLPMAPDLSERDVRRIVSVLAAALDRDTKPSCINAT